MGQHVSESPVSPTTGLLLYLYVVPKSGLMVHSIKQLPLLCSSVAVTGKVSNALSHFFASELKPELHNQLAKVKRQYYYVRTYVTNSTRTQFCTSEGSRYKIPTAQGRWIPAVAGQLPKSCSITIGCYTSTNSVWQHRIHFLQRPRLPASLSNKFPSFLTAPTAQLTCVLTVKHEEMLWFLECVDGHGIVSLTDGRVVALSSYETLWSAVFANTQTIDTLYWRPSETILVMNLAGTDFDTHE